MRATPPARVRPPRLPPMNLPAPTATEGRSMDRNAALANPSYPADRAACLKDHALTLSAELATFDGPESAGSELRHRDESLTDDEVAHVIEAAQTILRTANLKAERNAAERKPPVDPGGLLAKRVD